MENLKHVLMLIGAVILLPVLFPLACLGGWIYTTEKRH